MADKPSAAYDTAPLNRLSTTICALIFLIFAARASAEPVATLVTVGPGDATWEKFGHNMIRLQDDERQFDVCYNWGVFDFDKPNFIWNFVQGRPVYTMVAWRTQPLLDEYRQQDRRVTFQRLNLSPGQLQELIVRCETNRRPANADYRYDYFRDNCSTRVRDMIDTVTGGAISKVTKGVPTVPSATYRSESVRLMRDDFWASLGMDFAMGPDGDKPLDRWTEGFLPMSVAVSAADLTDPPIEAWAVKRPPPANAAPVRWPWLLLVGLAFASAVLYVDGKWRTATVAIWWLVSGLGGAFMVFMWTTDHVAAHANQNLWHYSPLALVALVAMLFRRRLVVYRFAMLISVVSIIGAAVYVAGRFGAPLAQMNGGFVMLALPINLAVAQALRPALTKPVVADDMTGL